MKDKKNIRFYNVIFPVWLLFIFPLTWLFVIPLNFAIDSLIILLGIYILKIDNKLEFYKKTILWVFLFGFAADILGGMLLLLTQFADGNGFFYEYITYAVSMNPWDNIYSLLYTLMAVIVAGILIYIFNRFISFRKIGDIKTKRIVSLLLAILTAPYLFLLPTETVYGGRTDNFTNHIVWGDFIQAEVYLEGDGEVNIMESSPDGHYNYGLVTELRNGINTAEKTKSDEKSDLEYTVVFYKNGIDQKKMDKIELYTKGDGLWFVWKDKYYVIGNENSKRIREAVTDHLTPPQAETNE